MVILQTRRARSFALAGLFVLTVLILLMAALPALAVDCTTCHTTMRTAHPATDSDAACFTCHPWADSAAPGPFPIPRDGSGGSHQGDWASGSTECWECHEDGLNGGHPGSSFTSISISAGVACESCHQTGMVNVFQVDASHGDPAVMHANVAVASCVSCHYAPLTTIHPTCVTCHNPTAPAGATCITCHPTKILTHGAAGFWGASDYYSWDMIGGDGNRLSDIGANPTNPGVHANYLANTAKCGICHSVHRARAGGVKLLDTDVATCAGCHRAGATTVTNVLVSWETGGPHSSGTSASCSARSCHASNPHGANGSQYAIFRSKLITDAVDAAIADAVDVAGSGILTTDLNADAVSTWTQGMSDAVVTGYTCNIEGCHEQSQLAVLQKGWSELRELQYPGGNVPGNQALKTGHLSVATADVAHASYASVTSCTSCHDQSDADTRSGFTFPHSQTARGASNTFGRSYLWMTISSGVVSVDTTGMPDVNMKAFDGACIKCHRDGIGAGIGLTN